MCEAARVGAVPSSGAATSRTRVAVFSPCLDAVSGVSTHARLLMASPLADRYCLLHFQVGSEGRSEGRMARLVRLAAGPFQLARFLLSQRIAIVHLNTSMDPRAYWRDLVFLAVARLLRRKVLNQIHGGALPAQFIAGSSWRRATLRWFAGHSNTVVVLSRQELAAWRAFAPGVRIEHIPNAIRIEAFRPAAPRIDDSRPLRLVYVGRIVREKGLFQALEAFAVLRRAGRAVRFEVAGCGRDEAAVHDHARRLGIESAVRFLGPVFGQAKADLWRRGDVFVLPTFSAEGLPYALLEAMAAGCVPIVCAAGAIGEAVRHGREALIVPARDVGRLVDAIAQLDKDRGRLARMATQAQRRVSERYSLERLDQAFVHAYARLTA